MQSLDVTTFDTALAEASGFVLIDFWASWCGPCQNVAPILESLEERYQSDVIFYKVNVEENPILMDAFKLKSIPAVLLLQPHPEGTGARVVDAIIGSQPTHAYVAWLERHLYPPPSLLTRLKSVFTKTV